MKVGDLVRKATSEGDILMGVLVDVEASMSHFKVCWSEYGTFWTRVENLEVISESR